MTERPYTPIIGRKQSADNDLFRQVFADIAGIVPRDYAESLVERAAADIKKTCKRKKVAYCWSGGKDSAALRVVAERAGVIACMIGVCNLEYPAFTRWLDEHAPARLEIVNTGQDIEWLAQNPHMLFPQDAKTAARWFRIVQHTAQETYYREHELDLILLGRRHADGNFTGRDGTGSHTARGVVRFSPIRGWTHEDVLAVVHYYDAALPPGYDWPNGFVVGTGPWPARQWTGSVEQGWREVHEIDPTIVEAATGHLPSAAGFLETLR